MRVLFVLLVPVLPTIAALWWRDAVALRRAVATALAAVMVCVVMFGLLQVARHEHTEELNSRTEVVEYRRAYRDGLIAAQGRVNVCAQILLVIGGCLAALALVPARDRVSSPPNTGRNAQG